MIIEVRTKKNSRRKNTHARQHAHIFHQRSAARAKTHLDGTKADALP